MFNDQDNELDINKLTNLDSVSVNREPSSDNELANKKYVDDSIGREMFPDSIKHYKAISKYLWEIIYTI